MASMVCLLLVMLVPFSDAWLFRPSSSSSSSSSGSSIPSSCYSPSGNDCGWYRNCLEKKIPCSGRNGDYAIAYAEKYCNRYQRNYNRFSAKGKRWVEAVRRCLQVSLVPLLRQSPSCSTIKDEAFDSHVPCYVNSNPSYCDLSDSDKDVVRDTVGDALSSDFWSTVGGFLQTSAACLTRG